MAHTLSTVKDALWLAGIYGPNISALKGGTLRIRRSYYYQPEESIEGFRDRVTRALEAFGYRLTRAANDWAAWPKTSYYTVELRRD
jgi:hypothetical protein